MIISYYGDGKGKTTAALGLALRASGYGKKVLFAQFVKGNIKTGEDEALKKIANLTHRKFGEGFIGILNDTKKISEHRSAAQKGFEFVKKNAKKFDILVLDEIFGAIKADLIDVEQVIELLKSNNELDIVMTGRPEVNELIKASDLVSLIKKIKHPYDMGIQAKRSLDY